MLSCLGSRCWMKTNAIPVLFGSVRKISRTASNPPADAPIPTMGHPAGSFEFGREFRRGALATAATDDGTLGCLFGFLPDSAFPRKDAGLFLAIILILPLKVSKCTDSMGSW